MIVHSNKQPGRNWTSSNLEDLRSGLRYRASSSTTGDQPQFRGQEFIHAKTFSKLIPKHLSLQQAFLKTQKGFYSPVADRSALFKTQKGFYSLQLAANASFVKAAELLQRCSLVAHFERSLGSARLSKGSVGLQVFTSPKIKTSGSSIISTVV